MISDTFRKLISYDSLYLSFLPYVFLNTLISLVISFKLLNYGIHPIKVSTVLATLVPYIAHFFLLNLIIGSILFMISTFPGQRLSLLLKVAGYSLFHAFMIIDVRIYTMFGFHINSLVINLISTEGAGDSVMIGYGTYLSFSLIMIVIVVILSLATLFINRYRNSLTEKTRHSVSRAIKIIFFILVALIITDKGLFAYGDLFNKITITKNAKLFPLYQPFTMKEFAADVLKINVNREDDIELPEESSTLNYPKEELQFDPALNRGHNILMIIVDGLRFDMLNEDVMPNLWRYSKENLLFTNHYSGGNGTRFGIFSILYGIHGSYWHNFLAQRRSAVLIDSLIELGYDFKVLSSTRLTFPEFRKTAFVRIPESIEDQFRDMDTVAKDSALADRIVAFFSKRKGNKPFFGFVFFDAPHQPYRFPDDMKRYTPVSRAEINYFNDVGKENIHLLKNRYMNAIYYDDSLIQRIITGLKDSGLSDDTLVIITGDHGEEFYENGNFGHTSAFNDYQLKTPLVMHVPGDGARSIERLTSHLDIVPTIMKLTGCVSPFEAYSQGRSLLENDIHPYITASKWDKSAIIDKDHVITFSTETYNLGSFEVLNRKDYSETRDTRKVIKEKRTLLLGASIKMSEFYR